MKRDASLIRLSRDHQRGLALAKRIDAGPHDVLGFEQVIDKCRRLRILRF